MSKLATAVIMSAMLSSTAFAADLPSRRAPVIVPPPPPIFSWTGFYAGGNAGYAFEGRHSYTTFPNPGGAVAAGTFTGVRPSAIDTVTEGFSGGGQIGYNYQLGDLGLFAFGGLNPINKLFGNGHIVVGIEADAAYTDLRSNAGTIATTGAASTFRSNTEFVGTVRGRVGYAIDNFLIYGTGGFAYGGVRDSVNFFNPAGGRIYSGARDNLRTGFVYGGGFEYAILPTSYLNVFHSSAVTIKAEFVRFDLGSTSVAVPNLAGVDAGYTTRVRTTGDIVRAGVNYKFNLFGAPASPVVARY